MATLVWIGFVALILGLLALDLGVFHRRDHVISITEALGWSAVWVAVSLVFNAFVYLLYQHHWGGFGTLAHHEATGAQAALAFFTGYLVEKSLSVDNIFVIAMIFGYFGVPLQLQHRVLYWGILGALVMRGVMIGAGAALIATFSWMIYVFGGLLLVTAAKLLVTETETMEPEKNLAVRAVRRLFPVTERYEGHSFFVRQSGRLAATPLFVALVVVETSDVMFAVDSIPAIFAITQDPFIVYTSNVCAILGLRALYFALAGIIERFRYLKVSLVFLLAFIGVKMIISHHHPIPTWVSLTVIAGTLFVGVVASLLATPRAGEPSGSPLGGELPRLATTSLGQARRVVVLVVSSTVAVLAAVAFFLPVPTWPVALAAAALVGLEGFWAWRWLRRLQREAEEAWRAVPRRDDPGGE
jgi:tellurite resistance protein TerC